MKDWKSKFKKRQENETKIENGALPSKPQKTRIVEVRNPDSPFALDYYDEPIDENENTSQEQANEDMVFLDKAGKTEELINTIADKGHLDVQDLRNFAASSHEIQKKKPLKIKDSPIVESCYHDIGNNYVVGVFQEYRLSLRAAYLGLASFTATIFSSFFAFARHDYYYGAQDATYTNGMMFFGLFLVLTLGFFVLALVAYYRKTLLSVGLDEVGNAYFYAEKGLRDIEPEQVVSFELFYHEHGHNQYCRYPFLHLEILTATGRKLMLSGQVPEGCDNYKDELDKPIIFAEIFQALGGAFVIEQMARLLRKADDCVETLE